MRAFLIAVLAAALAACSSTPVDEQSPAGVEDRAPGATKPAAPGQSQAQPIGQKPMGAIDLTAQKKPAPSPLTDPSSILSKRSIYFDFDRYDVKDEFKPLVEAHAKYLRDNPNAKMLIQGNTDERGGREYNLALGQRRAEAVKKMLLLLGARESQIEAVSLGEEKPKAQGSSEEAYAQNRRGDILYGGEF
jgi:peptidoglycan-associated lipoprotein